MYRDKERWNQDGSKIYRSAPATFNKPLHYKEPALVFTCSWSDWFIQEADEWRGEAWEIIKKTPHLTYQILTKRPERIKQCLPPDWGTGYPNVWLGVSAENQEMLDLRVPILEEIPAAVRFVSIEPLIGRIWDFARLAPYPKNGVDFFPIHWAIIGGESGNANGKYGYRDCETDWIETIMQACEYYKIPVFVKQLGTFLAKWNEYKDPHGGDIAEWPKHLQVRQSPVDV